MSIPMSAPSLSLEGKVAIVTGGGTGIGESIALEFAKAGADVVVASRTLANLEKVAEEVRALGRRSSAIPADMSKKSDIDNLVQKTLDEFGIIDILVNNAGHSGHNGTRGLASDLICIDPKCDEDYWDEVTDVNIRGVFLCCQAVINGDKGMIERKKGNIINMSSIAAYRGGANPYRVAKAGLNRLTTGLAWDLAPYNIRVNGIAPGAIKTPMGRRWWSEPERLKEVEARHPLGRVGEPIDIATIALFLASEASNFVTGQTIIAAGGPLV